MLVSAALRSTRHQIDERDRGKDRYRGLGGKPEALVPPSSDPDNGDADDDTEQWSEASTLIPGVTHSDEESTPRRMSTRSTSGNLGNVNVDANSNSNSGANKPKNAFTQQDKDYV